MPTDFGPLNTKIQGLKDEVTQTVGVAQSATALLKSITAPDGLVATAVKSALDADNSIDKASADAAMAAVQGAMDSLQPAVNDLAAAVAANPGGAPAQGGGPVGGGQPSA